MKRIIYTIQNSFNNPESFIEFLFWAIGIPIILIILLFMFFAFFVGIN